MRDVEVEHVHAFVLASCCWVLAIKCVRSFHFLNFIRLHTQSKPY